MSKSVGTFTAAALLFQDFQPLAAIALTPTAAHRLQFLTQIPTATVWVPESIRDSLPAHHQHLATYSGSLSEHLASLWVSQRSLVFCLATGAVVRLIAPLLQHKSTDPAIVVVDEAGQFVISLCGGHQGGADQLARLIALQIGATPVLTGSSHHLELAGIDILGRPFGWQQGTGDWTGVSAAIARQLPVQVIQEAGTTLWQANLPADHPFAFGFPDVPASATVPPPQARIWISPIQRQFAPASQFPKVQWHPRVLWVGIGCERGTAKTLIEQAVQQVLRANHLAEAAIAGVATIDLKADEVGLVEFCRDRGWPLRCFPADALKNIAVPNPSKVVAAEVGTPSVAEAAAILAATGRDVDSSRLDQPAGRDVDSSRLDQPAGRDADSSRLEFAGKGDNSSHPNQPARRDVDSSRLEFAGKGDNSSHPNQSAGRDVDSSRLEFAGKGDNSSRLDQSAGRRDESASLRRRRQGGDLRVAKQIIRRDGELGAVTIAIAQAEIEYTGRPGNLWLIGTGPGSLQQITPAAQTAIAQADVVIGYALYVDLVRPLLRPGQIIEALPITQERQRAERAIDLAHWGLTVAVISSGDCGIYGMAGLVLEALRAQGWDGATPGVQVFPGITALQAAASRVGAPLMHDFCAISLSDLLTPWAMIETRLTAAAQADFVVALYNPKSQTRTTQIATAQRLFLQHRDPQTPVALVKSAYRPDEQIHLTTLAELDIGQIDMLTTVLIGNQSTRFHQNWMITPRGYLGFTLEENPIA